MDVSMMDEILTDEEIARLVECDRINAELAEMEAAFGPFVPVAEGGEIPF